MNRKEFYNSLSEDMKARIKACGSEEEMMQVLKENMIELDPDVLETIGGGINPITPDIDCPYKAKPEPSCRIHC